MSNDWNINITGIPRGSPVNLYLQCDEQNAAERHAELVTLSTEIRTSIMDLSEQVDALSQNVDDIAALVDQILTVIKDGDKLAAELRKQIADLIAAANIDASAKAALAAKVDAAFAKSVAAEDKLRAAVPQVPPVGGDPLLSSYPSRSAFDAAVTAYKGPENVTLDGVSVRPATDVTVAPLDYFTHSADGSISTTGPTD